MGILSGIKRLFSAPADAPAKAEDTIEYKGFYITPAPMSDGGQYRVAATITKPNGESDEEAPRTHNFIRSDLMPNRDECISITINKAKMMIDQQGDNIFS